MGNYGIKVSLDGYDVLTATDRQLALKSSKTLQKVKIAGSTTVAANTEGSITHNLGYVPQFLVFGEDPDDASNMNVGNASWVYSYLAAWADTTKVYWKIGVVGGGPFDIYYYVFYDVA